MTIATGVLRLCRHFFLIAVLAVALGATARASIIDGYLPSRHDRFSSGGYGGGAVSNPTFLLAGDDLSGIGREGSHPVTMISPIHFLAAQHFPPSGTVTFVNQDNATVNFSIASTAAVGSTDLMVGTLTTAIVPADKITFYPTFSYTSLGEFDNVELLVYGKQHRVGRNELDGDEHLLGGTAANFHPVTVGPSTGIAATYNHAPGSGFSPDESFLESGDSGHPTFIRVGSQLGLLGIHWANGMFDDSVDANFDSFIPYYQPEIDALMSGSGYSLETISIPEPTSFVLLVLAVLPLAASRRTRWRMR